MSHLFQHLKTVHNHRKAVRQLCFKCGLYKQGLLHDLSKYSLIELIPSVKYWTGKRSPIEGEIEDKGYSMAWLHHQSHNKHHYNYWVDCSHDLLVAIPKKYLVEMFCDRVAASKTYLGDKFTPSAPYEYFIKQEGEKKYMNSDSYTQLENFLKLYSQEDEDVFCHYLRDVYLKGV